MRLFDEYHVLHGLISVHADHPLGDGRTLCGCALEGNGSISFRWSNSNRVTCQDCWRIIAHCKAIPARSVAYPIGRPNKPAKETKDA